MCISLDYLYIYHFQHLKSKKHEEQMEVRLTALDAMIEKSGYSFHTILERMKEKRKYNSSHEL